MDNDYYQHSTASSVDPYARTRGPPTSASAQSLGHHSVYSTNNVPATGGVDPYGARPSALRDYAYEAHSSYDDKKLHTAPTGQSSYSTRYDTPQHQPPPSIHSKYDQIHGNGSSSARGHGYDEVTVSRLSSYSSGPGAGSSAMPPHRETSSAYESNLHHQQQHHLEPSRGSVTSSMANLEKYFTTEEIKRFTDYNRFLVMSSPTRQKKFYEKITAAEYKRYCDFVDFEKQNNNKGVGGGSSSFKAAPPPPIPSAAALPPSIPTNYSVGAGGHPPYSFASSFYDEDKLSTGSGPILRSGATLQPLAAAANKSKYHAPSPPPIPAFMKATFTESSYDRGVLPVVREAAAHSLAPARFELPPGLSAASSSRSARRELSPAELVSSGHRSSSSRGHRRSRSRSRSISPDSRGRSSRYARHGSPTSRRDDPYASSSSYRDRDHHSSSSRDRDRDRRSTSRSRSRRTRTRSRSPVRSSRDHHHSSSSYHSSSRTESSSSRADKDRSTSSRDATGGGGSGGNANSRKLAPKEEHYYLLDALTKVKKIHKLKLEELEEIKKKDNDSADSYLYKKVASSVKDIEERIATVERQLEANRKVLGDSYPEVERSYEEKEREKKTSTRVRAEEAEAAARKTSTSITTTTSNGENGVESAKKSSSSNNNNNSKTTDSVKEAGDDQNNTTSSDVVISSSANIEATAETVAKLPKIPKLSAKKAVAAEVANSKESTPGEDQTKAKMAKSSSTLTSTSSSKSAKTESSSSSTSKTTTTTSTSKTESKETKESKSSSSTSRIFLGPVTEEEIDQVLPYYQWCSMCKNFFESTDEFIAHLHRDAHLNGLRTSDFALIKRAEEKLDAQLAKEEKELKSQQQAAGTTATNGGTDKPSDSSSASIENLGTEFLYPSKAFYCDLCAKFLYTSQQTELHLHSEKHLTLYRKYLQKNKEYEAKNAANRKNTFMYSYIMRTLIRMKDKGEDIVARVSQEMVRRVRAKEKEREQSVKDREKAEKEEAEAAAGDGGGRKEAEPKPSGSSDEVTTALKTSDEKTTKKVKSSKKKVEQVEESSQDGSTTAAASNLNGGDTEEEMVVDELGTAADADDKKSPQVVIKTEVVDDSGDNGGQSGEQPTAATVQAQMKADVDEDENSTETIIDGGEKVASCEANVNSEEDYEEVMDTSEQSNVQLEQPTVAVKAEPEAPVAMVSLEAAAQDGAVVQQEESNGVLVGEEDEEEEDEETEEEEGDEEYEDEEEGEDEEEEVTGQVNNNNEDGFDVIDEA